MASRELSHDLEISAMFGICIAVFGKEEPEILYKKGWVTNSKFPWMCLMVMNAAVSNPSTNHI